MLGAEFEQPDNIRKAEILKVHPHTALFLQADTYIADIAQITKSPLYVIQATEWMRRFSTSQAVMEETITKDYQQVSNRPFQYPMRGQVSKLSRMANAKDIFTESTTYFEIETMLGLLFVIGYDLKSEGDIAFLVEDIAKKMTLYGQMRNNSYARAIMYEALTIGARQYTDFINLSLTNTPIGDFILHELDISPVDPLLMFREFTNTLSSLDDLGEDEVR